MCPIFGHAPAAGGGGVRLGVGFGVGFGVALGVGAAVALAVAVAVGEAIAVGLDSTLESGEADDVAGGEPVELSVGAELADATAAISDGDGEPPGRAPPKTDCSARTTAVPATMSTAMATGRRERRTGRSTGFSARVPQSARLCRPWSGSCHDRQRGAL